MSARNAPSSSEDFDVIVVGLGAMGSAALYQLAKAGARVLGLDRYNPPHIRGSTHGDTRVTRRAIGEGSEYVALVTRSNELWREMETEVGVDLLTQCGGLMMGLHSGQVRHGINDRLQQTILTAREKGIAHEVLSTEQIRTRFPQFHLVGSEEGYLEDEAGFLRPEACVQAQLDLARRHGAVVRVNEEVTSYQSGVSCLVHTKKGSYAAQKIVLAAGPWIGELVSLPPEVFKVYRQTLFWFDLVEKGEYELYRDMPVFLWEFGASNEDYVYGFPALDGPHGGIKVASESYSEETTPAKTSRDVRSEEIEAMYEHYVKDRLPGLSSRCLRTTTCLYTVTPESRFVIDALPEQPNVIVASPCSGHGFKHAAAIGEAIAQLAQDKESNIDISSFSIDRLLRAV